MAVHIGHKMKWGVREPHLLGLWPWWTHKNLHSPTLD